MPFSLRTSANNRRVWLSATGSYIRRWYHLILTRNHTSKVRLSYSVPGIYNNNSCVRIYQKRSEKVSTYTVPYKIRYEKEKVRFWGVCMICIIHTGRNRVKRKLAPYPPSLVCPHPPRSPRPTPPPTDEVRGRTMRSSSSSTALPVPQIILHPLTAVSLMEHTTHQLLSPALSVMRGERKREPMLLCQDGGQQKAGRSKSRHVPGQGAAIAALGRWRGQHISLPVRLVGVRRRSCSLQERRPNQADRSAAVGRFSRTNFSVGILEESKTGKGLDGFQGVDSSGDSHWLLAEGKICVAVSTWYPECFAVRVGVHCTQRARARSVRSE